MDYISTDELDLFLLGANDVPTLKKDLLISSASRQFDRLCNVENDFFALASDTATEKIINGNGLGLLPLPPFTDSLASVTFENELIDSDNYLVKGSSPNQFLAFPNFSNYSNSDLFAHTYQQFWRINKPYTILAKWGFAEIPKQVKMGVVEIAISLSSGLDVAKALTLDESFSKIPMIVPGGFADKASEFFRERLTAIAI